MKAGFMMVFRVAIRGRLWNGSGRPRVGRKRAISCIAVRVPKDRPPFPPEFWHTCRGMDGRMWAGVRGSRGGYVWRRMAGDTRLRCPPGSVR